MIYVCVIIHISIFTIIMFSSILLLQCMYVCVYVCRYVYMHVCNVCIVLYCMLWYGMVWYGMVWYGMVWYGMVWYGMVWYVCMYVCVHIYIYIYIYTHTHICMEASACKLHARTLQVFIDRFCDSLRPAETIAIDDD